MAINVVPLNDWIIHDDSTICICEPSIEWNNNEMLIIHNAIDGRIEGDGQLWGVFKEG